MCNREKELEKLIILGTTWIKSDGKLEKLKRIDLEKEWEHYIGNSENNINISEQS